MSEKKQLNEEQLEKVTGGDNGDPCLECSDWPGGITPLYQVGQYVEVYNSMFHIRTKRGQISSIRAFYVPYSKAPRGYEGKYCPLYNVYIIEDNEYEEVLSDEIESAY